MDRRALHAIIKKSPSPCSSIPLGSMLISRLPLCLILFAAGCSLLPVGCAPPIDSEPTSDRSNQPADIVNSAETDDLEEPQAELSDEEKARRETQIENLIHQARAAERQRAHNEVRRLYREILEIDSKNAHAWLNLGRLELKDPVNGVDSYRRGIEFCSRALEYVDRGSNIYFNRGRLHAAIGKVTGDQEEVRKAIADYDRAIELFSSLEFRLERALAHKSLGNHAASHADNDEIVQWGDRTTGGDPDKLKPEERQIYNFALLSISR